MFIKNKPFFPKILYDITYVSFISINESKTVENFRLTLCVDMLRCCTLWLYWNYVDKCDDITLN